MMKLPEAMLCECLMRRFAFQSPCLRRPFAEFLIPFPCLNQGSTELHEDLQCPRQHRVVTLRRERTTYTLVPKISHDKLIVCTAKKAIIDSHMHMYKLEQSSCADIVNLAQ